MAVSVAETVQKEQKGILRNDTLRIFLLKHNDAKKHFLIMKYYHPEVKKTKLEKCSFHVLFI